MEFDTMIRAKKLMPVEYHNVAEKFGDLGTKDASADFTQGKISFAKGFVDVCRTVTEQIGQDLKLAPVEVGADGTAPLTSTPQAEPQSSTAGDAEVYDLRGVVCPMNYVKTKLKLEMMDEGEQLEIWLDAGDPIRNVPASLRNDGHKVLKQDPMDPEEQHFKVLVEKVEG